MYTGNLTAILDRAEHTAILHSELISDSVLEPCPSLDQQRRAALHILDQTTAQHPHIITRHFLSISLERITFAEFQQRCA
eukprot:761735-Amphidinium_carterae.1